MQLQFRSFQHQMHSILKTESIKILTEKKKDYESRLRTIQEKKIELEQLGLEPIEKESTESLENVFKKIRLFNKDREELKQSKDRTFDKLKDKVKSGYHE